MSAAKRPGDGSPAVSELSRSIARMVRWGLDQRVVDSVRRGSASPEDPRTWRSAGGTWDERAAGAIAAGHRVTAAAWSRQAFFCNRLAESRYFEDSAAKLDAYEASLGSFDRVVSWGESGVRRVDVRFEGVGLPGLFVPADGASADEPAPAVLVLFGADANKEEHLWASIKPVTERGACALVVDGPGHGWARRVAGIPAVHDFERFGRLCVDVLAQQAEVDPGRLGIAGSSLGGYYAPRCFAADDRLRACVVNSAVFNMATGFWDSYPPIRPQLQYVAGAASGAAARERYERFTLDELGHIDRPMRVLHGAEDRMIPPTEAERLCEVAGPHADLVVWPGASHNLGNVGAEAHPVIWDWLVGQISRG